MADELIVIEGVRNTIDYADSTFLADVGLTDENGKLLPIDGLNSLSDSQLDALLGIDEDGNIKPDVLAMALADLLKTNPFLYALVTAPVEGGDNA